MMNMQYWWLNLKNCFFANPASLWKESHDTKITADSRWLLNSVVASFPIFFAHCLLLVALFKASRASKIRVHLESVTRAARVQLVNSKLMLLWYGNKIKPKLIFLSMQTLILNSEQAPLIMCHIGFLFEGIPCVRNLLKRRGHLSGQCLICSTSFKMYPCLCHEFGAKCSSHCHSTQWQRRQCPKRPERRTVAKPWG